jgi:hypothetical protein
VLLRDRLNVVARGDRLRVKGVLRVIAHPPARVNVVVVPAWAEVRVTDG